MAGPLGATRTARPALALEYPMSLGVFEKYEQAQKAVDFLSDEQFPVQNCMIVGTELKQIERVTGRLNYRKAAMGGLASGLWFGLFIGFLLSFFASSSTSFIPLVLSSAVLGGVFFCVWAVAGYAATGGRRDFTSISQVVATRYEVLVEHKYAEQARQILAKMPGGVTSYTA
jgi:hypothetical protein